MAWQLIYTSAPRLLEAGRTGFGTVARHRAVSGMLASTVERFSQFARLPGHDPRRVVHTYRTVTAGSSIYHVFSCLRDAGSDYSGRTNHLAHHLIAEAREIRSLTGSGLTPADVLLGMSWLSSWTEPPRFLDPKEEIALSSFSAGQSRAWSMLTGNPDSSQLLSTAAALKGTYLILPPSINSLELFRESLLHAPQSGWQTSFTTCLEPNDEVGDFRWIGIPANSPLRAQAETSSRPVLDLTQPAQLPPPPAPVPPEPEPVVHLPEADAVPASSHAATSPSKVTLRQEVSTSQTPAASTMGGWDLQPRKKTAPKKSNSTLILSLVLVGLVLSSMIGYVVWKGQNEKKERQDFVDKVNHTWEKWLAPGALPQTKQAISETENIEEGRNLLEAHRKYFEQLHSALSKPNASKDFNIPAETENELTDLQTIFADWQELDAKFKRDWQIWTAPGTSMSVNLLLQKFQTWQKQRTAIWAKLASCLHGVHQPTIAGGFREALLKSMKQHVSAEPWDVKELPDLESLNKLLGPDQEINDWMKSATSLNSNDKVGAAEAVMKDEKLPKWLRDKAQEQYKLHAKGASKADSMADTEFRTTHNPTKKAEAQDDADSFEAKNTIFICLPKGDEDPISLLQQISLPKAPDMEIYVGMAADKHPPPSTEDSPPGTLKRWKKIPLANENELVFGESIMAKATSSLKFSDQGQISQLPVSSTLAAQGLRIVARSKDQNTVLYDLRILPSSGKVTCKLFAAPLKITSISSETGVLPYLGRFIKRLHFVGPNAISYKLRPMDASQAPYDIRPLSADHYEVIFAPPVTNDVVRKIADKQKEIEAVKARIESIKNEKGRTAKNLAGYVDRMAKLDGEIAAKEQEIGILNNEIAELQKPADLPRMSVDAGEYTLIALTGADAVLEVSKVLLTFEKSKL